MTRDSKVISITSSPLLKWPAPFSKEEWAELFEAVLTKALVQTSFSQQDAEDMAGNYVTAPDTHEPGTTRVSGSMPWRAVDLYVSEVESDDPEILVFNAILWAKAYAQECLDEATNPAPTVPTAEEVKQAVQQLVELRSRR
jgi:hypothetical protein